MCMHRYLRTFLLLIVLSNLASCKLLYPNYMFKDTRDFAYLELQEQENQELLIMPGDILSFQLYSRDGYKLIDIEEGVSVRTRDITGANEIGYLVREDGYAEFPLLGTIYVKGYTRLQLEELLEDRYSVQYNDPFILLKVTNNRVYLFMGVDGAQVINLPNENTTLLEVIALAGGVTPGAKSHQIRVIRGDYDNPTIKKVDLSTIDGLRDADMLMQPNDLIVVAPVTKVAPVILREVTPILALLTTVLTFVVLIRN